AVGGRAEAARPARPCGTPEVEMKTHAEYDGRLRSQRLADLEDMTAELERKLADARLSLERELEWEERAAIPRGAVYGHDERTELLMNNGRASAYRRGSWRRTKIAAGTAIIVAAIIGLVVVLFGRGASWPAS